MDNDFCANASERRQLIARIVLEAWERITPHTIVSGFVHAGVIPTDPRDCDNYFAVDSPPLDENSNIEANVEEAIV